MLNVKLFTTALLFLISVTTNCGENKLPEEKVQTSIPEKSICELISKEEVGKIMDAKFEESTQTLHDINHERGNYVSQCGYYTNKGMQHVAIMVRYFKGSTFPQTAEEFLNSSKTGDTEMDQELENALKDHIDVEGIGDVAFFYSLWESNSLVVHWNKSYEMILSMYDFNLDEPTMEKIKQLAKEVMKNF